jgi:flagella basal body P-ring formation protein FlgA
VAAAIAHGTCAAASAAEIELRSRCECAGPLVRLGDVAVVAAGDAEEASLLADLELFPVPPVGERRFATLREIQDTLAQTGCDLGSIKFTGASRVEIAQAGRAEEQPRAAAAGSVVSWARRRVEQAVLDFLRNKIPNAPRGGRPPTDPWEVSFELTDEQILAIGTAVRDPAVRAVERGARGTAAFVLAVPSADGPIDVNVPVAVAIRPFVVAAARPLARGTILEPDDLEMQPAAHDADDAKTFAATADVLGAELTRAVAPGQRLVDTDIRRPVVVRRGETILVESRSQGVRVRMEARAGDDGSTGDTIPVESTLNRQRFYVRITGPQSAEIVAGAAGDSPPTTRGAAREEHGAGGQRAAIAGRDASAREAERSPRAGRARPSRVGSRWPGRREL